MTDDFQKSQDRLGSSELDKRLENNLHNLQVHRKSLYHWLGNTKWCIGRGVQAVRISTEYFALMVGNLAMILILNSLKRLQKVHISLIKTFHKTAQSKDDGLSNNPANQG